MAEYALHHFGIEVSKRHSTPEACFIEAFEKGVVQFSRGAAYLDHGYSVAHVSSDNCTERKE